MAVPYLSVKVGKKGKAQPHADYIFRQGKYKNDPDKPPTKTQKNYEDLLYKSHGNMPKWAEDRPEFFWEMSDRFERKNGSTYREHVIALPRELSLEQNKAFIDDWIKEEIGDKHAYQYAIHNPKALDGKENPHVHLMFSDRTNDGIERAPDQYFKRYNSKNPHKGGAKKANTGMKQSERKELLKEQRGRFEVLLNRHLELANSNERINMKSLRDQGITDRAPVNFSMNAYRYDDFKESQRQFYELRGKVDRFTQQRDTILIDLDFDIDREIAKFAKHKQQQEKLDQEQAGREIEEERKRLERIRAEQEPDLHIDPPELPFNRTGRLRDQFNNLYDVHNDYIESLRTGEVRTLREARLGAVDFYERADDLQYMINLKTSSNRLEELDELNDMHREVEKLTDNFSKFVNNKTKLDLADQQEKLSKSTQSTASNISKCYARSERPQPQHDQQHDHTVRNTPKP